MAGAAASIVLAFPFFWLMNTGSTPWVFVAVILAYSIAVGAQYGVEPAFFSELFGTNVRYTGISIGYQVTAVFAGGLAPFIASTLVAWTGGDPWPVALYVAVASVISLVSAYLATETFQSDLADLSAKNLTPIE